MERRIKRGQSRFVERVTLVRELMYKIGVDGVHLRKRRSFAWLTGGSRNHIVQTTELGVADLVIFPERIYCVTTRMEAERIRDEELNERAQEGSWEWMIPEWYEGVDQAIVRLCEGKRMGYDLEYLAALPNGVSLGTELAQLSYRLDDDEQKRYRSLAYACANAVESTCREIRSGMTEWEIQAMLAAKVLSQGITPQVLLVATDERIFKYRHPLPTAKPFHRYCMLVLCGERWGLVANVTRLVHLGPLPDQLAVTKEIVANIDLQMNLATRPGTPVQQVLQTGIASYQRYGFADDWRYLHQGGPTGYAAREFLVVPHGEGIVFAHQAFAWNPSIRGVKSEDTILVGEQTNEFLTHTGEWTYMALEHEGQPYLRPDILIRS